GGEFWEDAPISRLEADLQNAAVIAIHQPSRVGAGEGYGPKAAHTGQGEPGVSLIGSPGCASKIGGDDHRALEVHVLGLIATDVAESKNCTCHRRPVGDRPCFT